MSGSTNAVRYTVCVRNPVTRFLLLLTLPVGLAACSLPTEHGSDAGRLSYVVSPAGVRIHGTTQILVIPARLADGPAPPLTSSDIAAQLFGGADGGPLAETYTLASGGSFTLRGEVRPWVTTSITYDAASKRGVITESGLWDHAYLALQAVDADVDFGLYDNDGPDGIPNSGDDDGVVDGGVVILHSGPNLYCTPNVGGSQPVTVTQWRPNGARFRTRDASRNGGVIEIGAFTYMSATGCSSSTVQSHVLAHELGHLLFGLPDLYRFQSDGGTAVWSTRRWVVGCWELMAAGSWGCGAGTPTFQRIASGFGAWVRYTVGWATPVVAPSDRDSTYELSALAQGGTVLRIPIKADEYLLIEYREKAPGDEIPPANGILIYHIAESLPINPTSPDQPNRVRLIEADDDSALDRTEFRGGDRGSPGDAFGVTRTSFRPGEHSQAKAVDGTPLRFQITEMTIDAARHRARMRVSPF
jgi:M6 family metalloprotease-like protein